MKISAACARSDGRGGVQVPAGSLPRTMEVIFRNDIVEQARAGDKLIFSGSLVVVPDVSVITAPGQRSLLKGAGARSPGILSCFQIEDSGEDLEPGQPLLSTINDHLVGYPTFSVHCGSCIIEMVQGPQHV